MEYKFVNRVRELDFLSSQYSKKGGRLVVLYGRRRVGKTALLNKFLGGKKSLYFLADSTSRFDQINSFRKLLAEFLDDDFLRAQELSSWDAVF